MTFLGLLARAWHDDPIALGCVPPSQTHSTVRLLAAAHLGIDLGDVDGRPGLTPTDAVALDHQLATLADATATSDPWTAALTQTGDQP